LSRPITSSGETGEGNCGRGALFRAREGGADKAVTKNAYLTVNAQKQFQQQKRRRGIREKKTSGVVFRSAIAEREGITERKKLPKEKRGRQRKEGDYSTSTGGGRVEGTVGELGKKGDVWSWGKEATTLLSEGKKKAIVDGRERGTRSSLYVTKKKGGGDASNTHERGELSSNLRGKGGCRS